ncbi:hypothetical protein M422DRAFT_265630 [Sphaerobolus stellatus SS14]|uniref:Uncharacterized protein n=1 Tax=Sphaerobolus stellatus (strain SS14) TaxID=990650 RepID=A0A0C9UTB2_SPHS4|nr:hypothetical protein M422DRAFT_265630 [Sphaerobolus stellatus SS14]
MSPPPPPPVLGRGNRQKRRTIKLRDDYPPEGPALLPAPEEMQPAEDPELEMVPSTVTRRFLQLANNIRLILVQKFWTKSNTFGLSRLYYGNPSCISDEFTSTADMATAAVNSQPPKAVKDGMLDAIWPYPNISSWRLGSWFWGQGDTKSLTGFRDLVNNVLLAKDFKLKDIQNVAWDKINDLLAQISPNAPEGEGWVETSVDIEVPTGIKKKAGEQPQNNHRAAKFFSVPGLWHRSIPALISSVFSGDMAAESFHFNPFKQFWKTSQGWLERVRDELFNSDAWFSLNVLSKWIQCKPTAHAAHHVAYLPTLPDSIIEFICAHVGARTADSIKTNCRRELFHAALNILFDEKFLEAWKYGIVVDCLDGIKRRVFPRIFTWSADYPEKVLLASIRVLGACPCPRCLVKKDDIPRIGMKADRNTREKKPHIDTEDYRSKVESARNAIYHDGFVVNGNIVDGLLKAESLTATKNTFSKVLTSQGFNFFKMLAVDLLHEIELGVWKALFTHLIRMLHAVATKGENVVDELNGRYRLIPTFGLSTIRLFSSDVSQMKKLAARDLEDILQLHMHSERTLNLLDSLTTQLGNSLRYFTNTICPNFDTVETPSERDARVQAQEQRLASKSNSDSSQAPAQRNTAVLNGVPDAANVIPNLVNPPVPNGGGGRRPCKFNMKTYKMHSLGHYVPDIREFGTTDSYSMQIGKLEHHISKSRYRHRTNKNCFTHQLARLTQRAENLRRSAQKLKAYKIKVSEHQVGRGGTSTEMKEPFSADEMFHIAKDNRNPVYLGLWLRHFPNDPALKVHEGQGGVGEEKQFSDAERDALFFQYQRMFSHAILLINFTSYDLHRDQDFINLRTPKCFVMVASNEDSTEHRENSKPVRKEFLWVRWFGCDPTWESGFKYCRLDRVGFVPQEDPDAFGFLDPAAVLRGAHLIPAFAHGQTIKLCAPSIAREDDGDWEYYYVNRFVDRDMLMRHLGVGIGHMSLAEKHEEDPYVFEEEEGEVVYQERGVEDDRAELFASNKEEEMDMDDMEEHDSADKLAVEDDEQYEY